MTLLTEIQALPTALLATKDEVAIATALSVGRTKLQPRLGGIGLVLDTLGPTDGAALLDSMQALSATNSVVKWAMTLLARGELDFGSVGFQSLATALLPPGAATLLLATARVSDQVDPMDVRRAIWTDNGASLI